MTNTDNLSRSQLLARIARVKARLERLETLADFSANDRPAVDHVRSLKGNQFSHVQEELLAQVEKCLDKLEQDD